MSGWDAALPIFAQRDAIMEALQCNQVLIVAGDTGSGKSTQLPQICLQLGRGSAGLIAHTQPRRLAARALATRIAEELAQPLGQAVGFRVRFADQVSPATRLVLMTDGLLLAQLASDPLLRRYDTIIIDEAHERTLNVDLLMGVLQRLLPRRPDLKLIVTSATLDVERISRFFGDAERGPAANSAAGGAGVGAGVGAAAAEAVAGAAFEDNKSEFSALVKLWRAYTTAREGPRRELRRWCKERRLSLLRLSEWDDVYRQVADRAAEMGIVAQRRAASYAGVHRALLAGFCSMVGARGEEGVYAGTRGVHFHLFPGSSLVRRRPPWVMAANIVETSRVFARRVAQVEPMWIESAAAHLLKREYLEPDWDEGREEVVARERISFLGLILSANRLVNYGPIAPEESRRIFAREALVYQRLQRRPDWLLANDAAIRTAQRMEERLRTRDLLQGAEAFVEFYDHAIPRQVSSAATLEYFSRHLTDADRAALTLTAEQIFARLPDAQALAQFPEVAHVEALSIPVDYRFAPGESQDGASLRIPLPALPGLTRAAVDAAVPGFAEPRIEALLRSLPKEARRSLIPIGGMARQFLTAARSAAGGAVAAVGSAASAGAGGATDSQRLCEWLRETRGIPESLLRFAPTAVAAHLTPQLTVVNGDKVLAQGRDLADLRRRCAGAARAELEGRARAAYATGAADTADTAGAGTGGWRRFEAQTLPETIPLAVEQGAILVYPTLVRRRQALEVQYEWSAAEAARSWRQGAVHLARAILAPQARDLGKTMAGDTPLLLAASPYLQSQELIDALLQLVFRRACFGDAEAPRTRAAYTQAVDLGRERLYPCFEELRTNAMGWFTAARAVRHALDDPRLKGLSEAAGESQDHLRRVLRGEALVSMPGDWLRQLPRYLKAEERRWHRNAARGGEPAHIGHELNEWSARYQVLAAECDAELRWIPELDDFRCWIEEYRVSLYAQELKTLGPISAARLQQRAAGIEAWLRR